MRKEGRGATELVAAEHGVLVVRGENHHVRVPKARSSSEIHVRRPHVAEADSFPLRQLAFRVRGLNAFGDLVRRFALHSYLGSQVVILRKSTRLNSSHQIIS